MEMKRFFLRPHSIANHPGPRDTHTMGHHPTFRATRLAFQLRQALRPAVLALPLVAVLAPAQAHAQAQPHAQAVQRYDIPAGPLTATLNRFGAQAGILLSFSTAQTADRTSPGVQGDRTVDQALSALLAGTGLQALPREGGGFVVRLSLAVGTPTGAATLAEVRVTAQAERSAVTEGTQSYAASESRAATGLSLSLRETPQSVSVITRQRMDDQGIVLQEDIARQTTGLSYAQYGPTGGDTNQFFARGFQIKNFQVDGVNRLFSDYPAIFQTSDMAMFDRVEVVRGASGLMSGAGTPGATINLVRKLPTAEFQGSARLTAGSWDFARAEVDLSSPLNASGSVRGRIVAVSQNRHSKVDYEQDRSRSLYGVVEADLSLSTLATVGFSAQDYDASGVGRGGRPFFYTDGTRIDWSRSASSGARWASARRDYRSVFASLEHRMASDWRLKAIYTLDRSSYDEIPGWTNEQPVDRTTGAGAGLWAAWWTGRPRQDTLDLTASGPFQLLGRQHQAAFGASVARTRNDSGSHGRWAFPGWDNTIDNLFTWDGRTPVQPDNPVLGRSAAVERSSSAYGSLQLRPTDRLSVIAGARITNWKRRDSYTDFASGETSGSAMAENGKLTPFAGLVLDVGRDWSAYASYTDIFQAQSSLDIHGKKLDPLLGRSYELGLKGELLDKRLQVGAAVYRLLQDNVAQAITGSYAPNGEQAYRAVKGAETRGFEVEMTGEIRRHWNASVGFARNIARDAERNRLNPEIPRNTLKLFTTYRLPHIGHGLTVGGGARWQSGTWSDLSFLGLPNVSRVEQKSYAVADLMVQYAINPKLTVSANLYNVFDRKYQGVSTSSYYGEARNMRVAVSMKF